MATLDTLLFDALAESEVITTAALGGNWVFYTSSTPAPTATSGSALHGARGMSIVTATGPARVNWHIAAPSTATTVASMYFKIDTMPTTGNVYLGEFREGSITRSDWRLQTNGTVAIRDVNVKVAESTTALVAGTWYRSEWMVGPTTQELRIYEGESTTALIAISGAVTNNSHDDIGCGVTAAPNSISISVDTIRIGDDWLGPYGAPAVPLDTPANWTFVADDTMVKITANATPVTGAASYEIEVEVQAADLTWSAVNTFPTTTLPLVLGSTEGLQEGKTYRGRIRALP